MALECHPGLAAYEGIARANPSQLGGTLSTSMAHHEPRAGAVHTALAARIPERNNCDLYTSAWTTRDPILSRLEELRSLNPDRTAQLEEDISIVGQRAVLPLVPGGPPRAHFAAPHAHPERGYPEINPARTHNEVWHRGNWAIAAVPSRYASAVEVVQHQASRPTPASQWTPPPPAESLRREAALATKAYLDQPMACGKPDNMKWQASVLDSQRWATLKHRVPIW